MQDADVAEGLLAALAAAGAGGHQRHVTGAAVGRRRRRRVVDAAVRLRLRHRVNVQRLGRRRRAVGQHVGVGPVLPAKPERKISVKPSDIDD